LLGLGSHGAELDWTDEPVTFWSRENPAPARSGLSCESGPLIACTGDLDLTIDGNAGLCANLTGGKVFLSGKMMFPPVCLQSIRGGGIEIVDNDFVTSMSGFSSLREVDGDLILKRNPHFVSLKGLDNLNVIRGDLIAEELGRGISMSALDSWVRESGRALDVNLHFPRRLQRTTLAEESTLPFEEDIIIGLQSFHGLGALQSVSGDFVIARNEQLLDLEGLNNLTVIGGEFIVTENLNLRDVSGVDTLQNVSDSISIQGNPSLKTLEGLASLEIIGDNLVIEHNEVLTEIGSLSGLTSIGGNFIVSKNHELQGFSDLALLRIEGSLILSWNRKLVSLQGFSNLMRVWGDLHVKGNRKLDSLESSFSSLVEIGGDALFSGYFEDFEGLETLRTIHGSMIISGLDNLKSLAGLTSIESIHQSLIIYGNPELLSIGEMNALTLVGEEVRVFSNPKLFWVEDFLDSLHGIGSYFQLAFLNGTIDCPKGSFVEAGDHAIIFDTMNPNPTVQTSTTTYGNFCTINCASAFSIPRNTKRMWLTKEFEFWDPSENPRCIKDP